MAGIIESEICGTTGISLNKHNYNTNLGEVWEYNVFVFGNHTQSNTEAEGRVAVGGDAIYNNYRIGSFYEYSKRMPKPGEREDLIVGGIMNIQGGINFSGNSMVGCARKVKKYAMYNRNSYRRQPYVGNPINFNAAEMYLKYASRFWASLPVNGDAKIKDCTLFLDGKDSFLNVFYLEGPHIDETGIRLSDLKEIVVNAPVNSTILINISGLRVGFGKCTIHRNDTDTCPVSDKQEDKNYSDLILWNFHEAVSWYNFSTGIKGSVLAPFADMDTRKGYIDGCIIGASLRGGMAAHHCPFRGTLPQFESDMTDNPESIEYSISRQKAVDDFLESSWLAENALVRILRAVKCYDIDKFSSPKSHKSKIRSYLQYMFISIQKHTKMLSELIKTISDDISSLG